MLPFKTEAFLSVKSRVICSLEQIIKGHVEIIGKLNESGIICLARTAFISADTVLIHIKVHCQFKLRNAKLFTQHFQSHTKHLLTLLSHIGIIKISRNGIYLERGIILQKQNVSGILKVVKRLRCNISGSFHYNITCFLMFDRV